MLFAVLLPVLHGREPVFLFELLGKIQRIAVAHHLGDLLYRRVGLFEPLARVVEPHVDEILEGSLSRSVAENFAQIVFADRKVLCYYLTNN